MKKLAVNKEACIGCGICCAKDPAHFDFEDDSLSSVISQDNIDCEEVKDAMDSCPTGAIHYEEDSDQEEHHCDNCENKDCCNK